MKKTRRSFLAGLAGSALLAPLAGSAQVVRSIPPPQQESKDSSKSETRRLEPTDREEWNRRRREHGVAVPSEDRPPLKPPALVEGSTIGIVAPASGVASSRVNSARATLQRLGFQVRTGKHLGMGFGYLAARDEERAEEFMDFVTDPKINCIMAVRGGYGVMRILPLLDFDVIRANPKVIVGYSDITALVNPIFQEAGMIAFHGPVATSSFDDYTWDAFRRTVMQGEPAGTFQESGEYSGSRFSEARASTLVGGKARGRLVGGNLSLVSDLMGTPYEIDLTDRILFLEEIAEEPYRVDRMLTQLSLSGQLSRCAGVALGRFTKCEAPRRGGEFEVSLSLEQVLRGILEKHGIPAVYGLSIGHIGSKLTVPVGGLAELDADAKTITLLEPAVIDPPPRMTPQDQEGESG